MKCQKCGYSFLKIASFASIAVPILSPSPLQILFQTKLPHLRSYRCGPEVIALSLKQYLNP